MKISNPIRELFKYFDDIGFTVSIDGTPKVTEYVRWKTVQEQVEKNVYLLKIKIKYLLLSYTHLQQQVSLLMSRDHTPNVFLSSKDKFRNNVFLRMYPNMICWLEKNVQHI